MYRRGAAAIADYLMQATFQHKLRMNVPKIADGTLCFVQPLSGRVHDSDNFFHYTGAGPCVIVARGDRTSVICLIIDNRSSQESNTRFLDLKRTPNKVYIEAWKDRNEGKKLHGNDVSRTRLVFTTLDKTQIAKGLVSDQYLVWYPSFRVENAALYPLPSPYRYRRYVLSDESLAKVKETMAETDEPDHPVRKRREARLRMNGLLRLYCFLVEKYILKDSLASMDE